MQKYGEEELTVRAQLKLKRNLLFADFERNPSNMRLATEINLIDDKIWEMDANCRTAVRSHSSKLDPPVS